MIEIPRKFAFDLEGTMVDLEKLHILAFQHVAETLEVVFGPEQFHDFVGAGDEAISRAIANLCRQIRREVNHQEIRSMKNKLYRDLVSSQEILPREGVPEYLGQAKVIGGDLVVASLTPQIDALNLLTRSGLVPFFKYFLTEAEVEKLKPDPEVYFKAASLLEIHPRIMLVHEDSPAGVKAAKAAGSPVVAFPVHENLQFDPEPDAIFLSWKGLDVMDVIEKLMEKASNMRSPS